MAHSAVLGDLAMIADHWEPLACEAVQDAVPGWLDSLGSCLDDAVADVTCGGAARPRGWQPQVWDPAWLPLLQLGPVLFEALASHPFRERTCVQTLEAFAAGDVIGPLRAFVSARPPDVRVASFGSSVGAPSHAHVHMWRLWQRPLLPVAWGDGRSGGLWIHQFTGGDTAPLHDHAACIASAMIETDVLETWAPSFTSAVTGGASALRPVGATVTRSAEVFHRLRPAVDGSDAWTVFLMGPTTRRWGWALPDGHFLPFTPAAFRILDDAGIVRAGLAASRLGRAIGLH